MINLFVKQAAHRKVERALTNSFKSLKFNYNLTLLHKKFSQIKRHIALIYNFKQLSYSARYSNYKKVYTQKAIKHYNSGLFKKVFYAFKTNTIKTTEEEITSQRNQINPFNNLNLNDDDLNIRFNKFLNNNHNKEFIENSSTRQNKIEGLKKLNKIMMVKYIILTLILQNLQLLLESY